MCCVNVCLKSFFRDFQFNLKSFCKFKAHITSDLSLLAPLAIRVSCICFHVFAFVSLSVSCGVCLAESQMYTSQRSKSCGWWQSIWKKKLTRYAISSLIMTRDFKLLISLIKELIFAKAVLICSGDCKEPY